MTKRIIIGLLTGVLITSLLAATPISAKSKKAKTQKAKATVTIQAIQDTDGDGICDNLRKCGNKFVDADNDGICDNQKKCQNKFVDTDNDGVCDNRGSRTCSKKGSGKSRRGCRK